MFVKHCQQRILEDRGALFKDEGDFIRCYKATHEETFLSGWLREEWKERLKKWRE